MNNTPSYIQARDCDFLRHCIAIARKSPGLTLSQVVKLALARRPEYFYIEFDRASRIVNCILKNNKALTYSNEETIRQAEDLVEKVRTTVEQRNIPIREALTHVLNNSRPNQFYISYRQAMRIARRKLKNAVVIK